MNHVPNAHSISAAHLTERPSAIGLWRPPSWIGFLWGFTEATLFFIIPDLVLSWASLAGVRAGIKILGAILAGAVIGGICMYTWALWRPDSARSAVAAVPFVRTKMFEKVQEDYRAHGVSGIFYTLGTGIPYKVYAVLAPPVAAPVTFGLITIPARLERLALSWLIPTMLGFFLRRWIRNHRRVTAALWLGFWVVTYAIYWSSVGR
jgi:membrane protein YqaA with SNARE-associated domain